MTSPYRAPAVFATTNSPPRVFALAPFGGERPDCPACTKFASTPGGVCTGKRSFWRREWLCPNALHFHPRCAYCGHTWLMAARTGGSP